MTRPRLVRKGALKSCTPEHCRDCEVPMVPRRKGYAPSHSHGGGGRCQRCYGQRRRDARRTGPARWSALVLLAEYEFWKAEGLRTKQDIADRLGVKFATLDRALVRGRAYRRRDAELAASRVGREAA